LKHEVERRDLGEEGAGDRAEWVEVEKVDDVESLETLEGRREGNGGRFTRKMGAEIRRSSKGERCDRLDMIASSAAIMDEETDIQKRWRENGFQDINYFSTYIAFAMEG
jgi:hypothetical protein